MADYKNARAKKTTTKAQPVEITVDKKTQKKIKKSPVAICLIVCLIAGAVLGVFLTQRYAIFEFNDYYVNGVASAEQDYIEIDLSAQKSTLEQASDDPVSLDDIVSAITLSDGGVDVTIFGKDMSDTVTVAMYYREDISHDIVAVDAIDLAVAGIYYIEYTSSHFLFAGTKLIRTIIVMGVEIDG